MLIDTHIWIWWVNGDPQLKPEHIAVLAAAQPTGIEVSIISCWEVAKLVEYKRLTLTLPVLDWLNLALSYPGVRLLPLTPEIVVFPISCFFYLEQRVSLIVSSSPFSC